MAEITSSYLFLTLKFVLYIHTFELPEIWEAGYFMKRRKQVWRKNNSEEEINKNIAWGEKYFSAQLPEEQPGKQRPMGGGSDGGFPIHRQWISLFLLIQYFNVEVKKHKPQQRATEVGYITHVVPKLAKIDNIC